MVTLTTCLLSGTTLNWNLGQRMRESRLVSSSMQVPEPNSRHSELIASSDAGSRGKTWVMRLLWQKLLPAELSHCSKTVTLGANKIGCYWPVTLEANKKGSYWSPPMKALLLGDRHHWRWLHKR